MSFSYCFVVLWFSGLVVLLFSGFAVCLVYIFSKITKSQNNMITIYYQNLYFFPLMM